MDCQNAVKKSNKSHRINNGYKSIVIKMILL
jgi:hypothetical protein